MRQLCLRSEKQQFHRVHGIEFGVRFSFEAVSLRRASQIVSLGGRDPRGYVELCGGFVDVIGMTDNESEQKSIIVPARKQRPLYLQPSASPVQ